MDELEGLVARGGDARVDVGLILDEVRLHVGFVDIGRTLGGLISARLGSQIWGHVPRIEEGRGKVGGGF